MWYNWKKKRIEQDDDLWPGDEEEELEGWTYVGKHLYPDELFEGDQPLSAIMFDVGFSDGETKKPMNIEFSGETSYVKGWKAGWNKKEHGWSSGGLST